MKCKHVHSNSSRANTEKRSLSITRRGGKRSSGRSDKSQKGKRRSGGKAAAPSPIEREFPRLTCSGKGIASGELPHSGQDLTKSTGCDSHAENDIRMGDVAYTRVVPRENKRGRCEGEQSTGQTKLSTTRIC